jgi:hypothetical protein
LPRISVTIATGPVLEFVNFVSPSLEFVSPQLSNPNKVLLAGGALSWGGAWSCWVHNSELDSAGAVLWRQCHELELDRLWWLHEEEE